MDKDLELMVAVLIAAGPPAYGEDNLLPLVASEWLAAGFSPDEAGNWLEADCWSVSVAQQFAAAHLEPEDVSFETFQPIRSTVADKASTGLLSVEAAIRIATSQR